MDNETIYALGGIIVFLIMAIITFRSKTPEIIKSKTQKREEIVEDYKNQLKEALITCSGNKEAQIEKKKVMLKKFSDELSRNIFFDADDIKVIIFELAQKD